ncbi:Gfo/Idh/MocA family oxidoreductase [Rhizobium sp. RHZ02]|uniref:Gfo/Idh/MocA family protein n=1 Tax=Rhizobium sp. RHZ02 TaxID=2769306 RepID=UPI00178551C2|nr:Gfo/Idh/MocA family oxidoreductase [Rhizobium sp. RHZ02]MBD9453536.1 Gfo/Idh/MocA family oxidoreductase [Rhizobium sp. RHZ02]
MTPLNILLSGPGLIGRQHAKLILEHEDCILGGIVAPPSEPNVEFGRVRKVPVYTSVEDAIQSACFDAAIISSPNRFHFEQAETCVRAGIPALVEKPITDTLRSAQQLADLSDQSGVPILVGHHRTYSPLLVAAEGFLRSGEFGRPVALQGSALFYKPAQYFLDGPWRTKSGGGPVLINLIHEIGLMRLLFGEIVSVFADASNALRQFEVEDTVSIALRFENGALGSFLLSDVAASNKSWEMTSGENPKYPHYPDSTCYHFAGSNGSLDFPSMLTRHYRDASEASWWSSFSDGKLEFSSGDPLRLQLDHFVQVSRKSATPKISARDGYKNMLVVEAINMSILGRRMIDLSEVFHRYEDGSVK